MPDVTSRERCIEVDGLPKVDLHLHQERLARVRQLAALRGKGDVDDWVAWRNRMLSLSPGMPRLQELWDLGAPEDARDNEAGRLERFELTLAESARDGAILTELRVGNELLIWPGVVATLREAERRVRLVYPSFHAELVGTLKMWQAPNQLDDVIRACLRLAGEGGLGGVDFLYRPYVDEADWSSIYTAAERLADAGLGITVHAGEFSRANIATALRTPGITRIGHAVYAASDDSLCEQLRASEVAVECCLTSNVVLGAVGTYAEHPIRSFRDRGIRVVLGTDNPLELGTSIANEYRLAAELGLTTEDLRSITRSAVDVSFAPPARKSALRSIVGEEPRFSAADVLD